MHAVTTGRLRDVLGGLPPGVSKATPYWGQGNWLVSILPYIEKGDLGSKYHDYGVPNGKTYYDTANINDVTGKSIPVMRCPSDTPNFASGSR